VAAVAEAASWEPFWALVKAAVTSDDPRALLLAAAPATRRPLALVGGAGEPLAAVPDDDRGRRALDVATAAAAGRVAPPGWSVLAVGDDAPLPDLLAVGPGRGPDGARDGALLEMLAALVAEQRTRVALKRTRTEALVRRLVGERSLGAERARREADAVGVGLAAVYRAAVVVWRGDLAPRVLEPVRRLAPTQLSGALVALVDRRLILLAPGAEGARGDRWIADIVARLRAVAPSSCAQAVVAERAVEPGSLGQCLAELALPPSPLSNDAPMIVSGERYALDALLTRSLPQPEASRFVEDRLGRLIAWDRQHGSDLLRVLEAALDTPRHEEAARRCYMHRNTFRRHLRQATALLHADLDDPNVRLAVHVALKLLPTLRRAPHLDGGRPNRAR